MTENKNETMFHIYRCEGKTYLKGCCGECGMCNELNIFEQDYDCVEGITNYSFYCQKCGQRYTYQLNIFVRKYEEISGV